MEAFTTLHAVAMPFDQVNVDTDQITPARFLAKPRPVQAENVFRDLRYDANGKPVPDFPMNIPAYNGARILVGNKNFGCGSSRETAVSSLVDNGFRAFIAPSFGDIFFNNCFQNGALPICLPDERVAEIRAQLHALPGAELFIDLEAQSVRSPDGREDRFDIDPFRKECLLKGVDEIGLTLGYDADIKAFEQKQAREEAWLDI